jgi:hypothetical protein
MLKPFMQFLDPEEQFILSVTIEDGWSKDIRTPEDFNKPYKFESKEKILKGRTVEGIVLKALEAYKNQIEEEE